MDLRQTFPLKAGLRTALSHCFRAPRPAWRLPDDFSQAILP